MFPILCHFYLTIIKLFFSRLEYFNLIAVTRSHYWQIILKFIIMQDRPLGIGCRLKTWCCYLTYQEQRLYSCEQYKNFLVPSSHKVFCRYYTNIFECSNHCAFVHICDYNITKRSIDWKNNTRCEPFPSSILFAFDISFNEITSSHRRSYRSIENSIILRLRYVWSWSCVPTSSWSASAKYECTSKGLVKLLDISNAKNHQICIDHLKVVPPVKLKFYMIFTVVCKSKKISLYRHLFRLKNVPILTT